MKNLQKWNPCVLSPVDGKKIVFKEVLQDSEPESLPNNRESTPPTDNNKENTRNTCEDRKKLAVDKL